MGSSPTTHPKKSTCFGKCFFYYNENGKSLGWGSFDQDIYADIHLTLEKGTHTLRIEKTEEDVGFAELESFDRLPCSLTGGVPQPIPDRD